MWIKGSPKLIGVILWEPQMSLKFLGCRYWNISLEKWKHWPAGGATVNVMGSSKSRGWQMYKISYKIDFKSTVCLLYYYVCHIIKSIDIMPDYICLLVSVFEHNHSWFDCRVWPRTLRGQRGGDEDIQWGYCLQSRYISTWHLEWSSKNDIVQFKKNTLISSFWGHLASVVFKCVCLLWL